MSIIDSLTSEIIDFIHLHYTKEENRLKIDSIFTDLFQKFFERIKPYFILLTALLLLLIILQAVQFYYYIKIFLKQIPLNDQAKIVRNIFALPASV